MTKEIRPLSVPTGRNRGKSSNRYCSQRHPVLRQMGKKQKVWNWRFSNKILPNILDAHLDRPSQMATRRSRANSQLELRAEFKNLNLEIGQKSKLGKNRNWEKIEIGQNRNWAKIEILIKIVIKIGIKIWIIRKILVKLWYKSKILV